MTLKSNYIYSISGGKDSTAMLLMAIERKEAIHSAIFLNTGWEFPQMINHIDLLEARTGIKIWRLQPRLPFEYWMFHRPIIARKGPLKGKVHRLGNGWPSAYRRWCTREKVNTLEYYMKPIPDSISCIGYASGEQKRIKDNSKFPKRYPLIEWGITEKEALRYCHDKGYHWDGLYNYFPRVSCYCCPLQSLKELRTLRHYFPELWKKMLEMDSARPEHNRGFKGYKTVNDLELRFNKEDKCSFNLIF